MTRGNGGKSPGTQVQHTLSIGTKGTEFRRFLASKCGTVRAITKSARGFAPTAFVFKRWCRQHRHSETGAQLSPPCFAAKPHFNTTAHCSPVGTDRPRAVSPLWRPQGHHPRPAVLISREAW